MNSKAIAWSIITAANIGAAAVLIINESGWTLLFLILAFVSAENVDD